MALTPISAFRPRRWHGALLPDRAKLRFEVLEAQKRPVSVVADHDEFRDVVSIDVEMDHETRWCCCTTRPFAGGTHFARAVRLLRMAIRLLLGLCRAPADDIAHPAARGESNGENQGFQSGRRARRDEMTTSSGPISRKS